MKGLIFRCKLRDEPEIKFDYVPLMASVVDRKKVLIKKVSRLFTFAGFMLLAACGDGDSSKQADTDSNKSANPALTSSVKPIKSLSINLLSTPLDKKAFIGNVAPEVKEAAPCPYLSDEAALATVKTSWVLKRRKTSNEQCYWSKNLGFSIKLTVEPLATAKPLQDRIYNLKSPPVLKQQSEPGNNAVVLYDTAWEKERPYAMSFEQDNKLIMIYITGMSTDAVRLTAAAKEVSAKLPTAPILEQDNSSANAFNMCETWNASELESIIGGPVQATLGDLDCKWETGSGNEMKQIRVMIYSGKSYPWESVISQGARDIPDVGERGIMEKKRKRTKMPGHVLLNALYEDKLVTVSVTDTIPDHEAVALALSKNIDKRFK